MPHNTNIIDINLKNNWEVFKNAQEIIDKTIKKVKNIVDIYWEETNPFWWVKTFFWLLLSPTFNSDKWSQLSEILKETRTWSMDILNKN